MGKEIGGRALIGAWVLKGKFMPRQNILYYKMCHTLIKPTRWHLCTMTQIRIKLHLLDSFLNLDLKEKLVRFLFLYRFS